MKRKHPIGTLIEFNIPLQPKLIQNFYKLCHELEFEYQIFDEWKVDLQPILDQLDERLNTWGLDTKKVGTIHVDFLAFDTYLYNFLNQDNFRIQLYLEDNENDPWGLATHFDVINRSERKPMKTPLDEFFFSFKIRRDTSNMQIHKENNKNYFYMNNQKVSNGYLLLDNFERFSLSNQVAQNYYYLLFLKASNFLKEINGMDLIWPILSHLFYYIQMNAIIRVLVTEK